jgi:uracil-xanthine permease
LQVGITWAGGGVLAKENFGNPQYLGIVLVVLGVILLLNRISTGFVSNVSVLIGLIVGFLVAIPAGLVNFEGVQKAPWFAVVYPFRFGRPTFDLSSVISICLVMIVVMVESTGMFLAMGEICDVKVGPERLAQGLAADGLGTIIGGLFNTFPYTSFSQNVGLVGITGVRSRYVVAVSGLILISLGLFPKMATIIASIPQPVLGGAGLCMFGMVAATGIKILSRVDFSKRHNLLIMAVSIAVGMIPLVQPTFFNKMPKSLDAIVHSGITLTAITAVLLNTLFNGASSAEDMDQELAATAAAASEH